MLLVLSGFWAGHLGVLEGIGNSNVSLLCIFLLFGNPNNEKEGGRSQKPRKSMAYPRNLLIFSCVMLSMAFIGMALLTFGKTTLSFQKWMTKRVEHKSWKVVKKRKNAAVRKLMTAINTEVYDNTPSLYLGRERMLRKQLERKRRGKGMLDTTTLSEEERLSLIHI